LHGGTAVWRCYGGGRFSYDIDAYFGKPEIGDKIKNELTFEVRKYGINIEKFRIIEKSFAILLSLEGVDLKLDIEYKKGKHQIPRNYEKVDGSFRTILTLSPEDLI